MAKYELGGHEVKQGTGGEGVTLLDQNKTIVVTQLTGDEPLAPAFEKDLKNINDVFAHYKPKVEVEFEDAEGSPVNNNLSFSSIADFGKKGLIKNSEFLQDLESQRAEYQKFVKMLKIKQMGNILKDGEAKQAYINGIKAMIEELEQNGA